MQSIGLQSGDNLVTAPFDVPTIFGRSFRAVSLTSSYCPEFVRYKVAGRKYTIGNRKLAK